MGGITLNVFVAALFYDPVEKHMKKVDKEDRALVEPEGDLTKFVISEDSMTSLPQIPHNDSFLEQSDVSELGFNRSASSAAVPALRSPQRERKISVPTGKHEVMKYKQGYTGSKYNMNSNSALHAVPEGSDRNGADVLSSQGHVATTRRYTAKTGKCFTSSHQL